MSPGRSGLAAELRSRTRELHTAAERSGFISMILRGQADRAGYALFLRNLLAAYQVMERGLRQHRLTPGVRAIALPALFRAAQIENDLQNIAGEDWHRTVPLLPAGEAYARRIAEAAHGDGALLIGHAYTRYLGDLNGGQGLKRLLSRLLNLGPDAFSMFAFPLIPDSGAFTEHYREALDRAGLEVPDPAAVVAEAILAFRLNIDLSEAVEAAVADAALLPRAS